MKTYITPTISASGDVVRNTRSDSAVHAKPVSVPDTINPLTQASGAAAGFYL